MVRWKIIRLRSPASEPNVLLVKRITAINDLTTNPNDNTALDGELNDGIADSADDHANWSSNYLVGAINGGIVRAIIPVLKNR